MVPTTTKFSLQSDKNLELEDKVDTEFLASADPTEKLFEMITFANKNFPNSFFMKIDDSTLVHIPHLINLLGEVHKDNLWMGSITINPPKPQAANSEDFDDTMVNKGFWKECTYYPNRPG
jgi:hypothetical protein